MPNAIKYQRDYLLNFVQYMKHRIRRQTSWIFCNKWLRIVRKW